MSAQIIPFRRPGARPCHECGVAVGEVHVHNCLFERCPLCGGQYFSCMCPFALAGYMVVRWDIGGMHGLKARYPELNTMPRERWLDFYELHRRECDRVGRIRWGFEHLAAPRKFIVLPVIQEGAK